MIFYLWIHLLFFLKPLLGKKWVSFIKKEKPHILQVVEGALLGNNLSVKVLKKQNGKKIHLEFLAQLPDQSFRLINSLILPGSHDGYLEYQEGTTSLALIDDNGDGTLEVIAPTFDSFLRPQINLVHYNFQTKKFELQKKSEKI